VGDRLDVEGGLAGERPASGEPVPNRTDAAFAELEELRAEARSLGLEDFDCDPLAVLRSRVEQARTT
jgi:hypothetical protein